MKVQEYYEEHIKDKLSSIDLDQISDDELATKHTAAVRATFEPEWKILEKYSDQASLQKENQLEQQKEIQKYHDSKKLVSILSLLPESTIIPKNRLIIYSGMEKFGKTKLIRPAQSAINLLDELNLIDILEDGKSVRIHPLLREFVLEKVQKDQNVENLMLESIINLKKRYYDDFSFLVDEYARERDGGDIDSILDDFKMVLEWSKKQKLNKIDKDGEDDDSIINSVSSLYKILEQESHNLRPKDQNSFISTLPDEIDKHLVFAQQVHIRAIELGEDEIVQKSREYLQAKNRSFFDILWARVKDKSALIRILEGHSEYVNSVAITPDSTKIVSGSLDNTIKVWDLAVSGRLLNTLEGHSDSVYSVAITPDGTKIVSGSGDNTIKVWDLASGDGRLLNTLEGHSSSVSSVAVTPDSTKIVSGSWDNIINVWDLNNGSNTFSSKFDSSILSIAISTKKRNIMAIGNSNGDVYVMDI